MSSFPRGHILWYNLKISWHYQPVSATYNWSFNKHFVILSIMVIALGEKKNWKPGKQPNTKTHLRTIFCFLVLFKDSESCCNLFEIWFLIQIFAKARSCVNDILSLAVHCSLLLCCGWVSRAGTQRLDFVFARPLCWPHGTSLWGSFSSTSPAHWHIWSTQVHSLHIHKHMWTHVTCVHRNTQKNPADFNQRDVELIHCHWQGPLCVVVSAKSWFAAS